MNLGVGGSINSNIKDNNHPMVKLLKKEIGLLRIKAQLLKKEDSSRARKLSDQATNLTFFASCTFSPYFKLVSSLI